MVVASQLVLWKILVAVGHRASWHSQHPGAGEGDVEEINQDQSADSAADIYAIRGEVVDCGLDVSEL